MKNRKLSLDQRKGLMGMLFVSPWVLGFVLLFMVPLFESFHYSLSNLELSPTGMSLSFLGSYNYVDALTQHQSFNRTLTESVMNVVVNVPLILFFSLFSAVLLNRQFRGRGLARAIFFLPVILASGAIASIESGDFMRDVIARTSDDLGGNVSLLQSFQLRRLLLESGLNEAIISYLTGAVDRIYQIVSSSGVQILIFLAGLQSISPSLYEASKIEGATGYESFWKITFPMISPLILTNVLYTIIDSFANNEMTTLIQNTAFKTFNFGLGSAMSWIYFVIISIILLIIAALVNRKVFYYD